MIKAFTDFGVPVKIAAACSLSLLAIIAIMVFGLISVPQLLLLCSIWGIASFLALPTRHLVVEQYGPLRKLPPTDRRAARIIQINQRQIYTQAKLVGHQINHNHSRNGGGNAKTAKVEIPIYPRLSRPTPAPYGFDYNLELPGHLGISAAKAVKAAESINGHISFLLRRAAPTANTEVEPTSGHEVKLRVRLRDEWSQVVTATEVE